MTDFYDITTGIQALRQGDHNTAFQCFYNLCQSEQHHEAEKQIMGMFHAGLLTEPQISDFLGWLNREAERGEGFAAFNAAMVLEKGTQSVKPNLKMAVKLYEEAIHKEIPEAHLNLGLILISGSGESYGVPVDTTRGEELLAKACEMGSREAAYTLGSFYLKGEQLAKDQSKAFIYLALAAILGHEKAKEACGLLQTMTQRDFKEELAAARRIEVQAHNYRAYFKALDAERRY